MEDFYAPNNFVEEYNMMMKWSPWPVAITAKVGNKSVENNWHVGWLLQEKEAEGYDDEMKSVAVGYNGQSRK